MSKRRGNGEGTIMKRSDGRWQAQVSLPSGKRKTVYGKSRQEVASKLADALQDLKKGILPANDRQTVEQYLTSWLGMVKHQVDASSSLAYRFHMQRVIKAFGKVPLSKLTPDLLERFYAKKLDEGLAPTTVNTMHGVLHHALEDAVRLDIIPRNVTKRVKPPRFEPKPKNALTEEQAQVLLQAAKGERLEALYFFALSTGMREGELFALEWRDVDFARGEVHVRQGLQNTGHGYILDLPKTKRSRRTIAVNTAVLEVLREHRVRMDAERQVMGELWESAHDFVFPNHFGRHKQPSVFLQKEFSRVRSRAGLPTTFKFHDLRHTFASLMLTRGVHVKVVSEMLGHADIGITLRIYGHVLPNMQRDAADMMSKILGGFDSSSPR